MRHARWVSAQPLNSRVRQQSVNEDDECHLRSVCPEDSSSTMMVTVSVSSRHTNQTTTGPGHFLTQDPQRPCPVMNRFTARWVWRTGSVLYTDLARPILYTLCRKKIGVSQKLGIFPSWTLTQTLDSENLTTKRPSSPSAMWTSDHRRFVVGNTWRRWTKWPSVVNSGHRRPSPVDHNSARSPPWTKLCG